MKKKFTIEIDIDTDQPGDSKAIAAASDVSKWTVLIRRDVLFNQGQDAIVPALAHELGHVIGYNCDLPGNMADPRFGRAGHSQNISPEYSARVLNSENEAWDIAERMLLIKKVREWAVKTYEKNSV